MTLSGDAIEPLLAALANVPLIREKALEFPPAAKARFQEVSSGWLTWVWSDRHAAERLKATLGYHDADGQIVIISIVVGIQNVVTEIELWRGDDQPLQSVPQQIDIW